MVGFVAQQCKSIQPKIQKSGQINAKHFKIGKK